MCESFDPVVDVTLGERRGKENLTRLISLYCAIGSILFRYVTYTRSSNTQRSLTGSRKTRVRNEKGRTSWSNVVENGPEKNKDRFNPTISFFVSLSPLTVVSKSDVE